MTIEPNRRGRAQRSHDRDTRYATHSPALLACIAALGPGAHAFEHGMGKSSTPLFHVTQNVVSISSVEYEIDWSTCNSCVAAASGTVKPHDIRVVKDDVGSVVPGCITDAAKTVALVDGFGAHRIVVLGELMNAGVAYIVEHDAEMFTWQEVSARRSLATTFNYGQWQYHLLDPETAIYVSPKAEEFAFLAQCVKF